MVSVLLSNDRIRVEIDPGYGADILSLFDLVGGVELLFSTPWRQRADAIRAGVAPLHSPGSEQTWLERYRGGWQTLCPNAGPPREYEGALLGFHGEASTTRWTVETADEKSVTLSVQLFTVPLVIRRRLSIDERSVRIFDELTNVSTSSLTVDYSHHPAFGGAFLDAGCLVTTNATRFTSDAASAAPALDWDEVGPSMSQLPGPESAAGEFGWLSGFPDDDAWAAVTNPALGITARVSWDAKRLPNAWWWQEFNSTPHFPWFGCARVFAIEPASVPTSGPLRVGGVTLAPGETVPLWVRVDVEHTAPG